MLAKCIVELWGHGSSRVEAGQMIKMEWKEEWLQFCREDVSICFRVIPFCKQYDMKEQISIIEVCGATCRRPG